MLTACHTAEQGPTVTATPAPVTLTTDRTGHVESPVTFRIKQGGLKSRARLVITPQLMRGDSVYEELQSVVADGPIYTKKIKRLKRLEGYNDPYADVAIPTSTRKTAVTLPYTIRLTLPEPGTARLRAMVSADGCGSCTGIDTLSLASITYQKPKRKITVRKPKVKVRQKVHNGDGTAHLQFAMNRFDIRPEMGQNQAELERMARDLEPVIRDTKSHLQGIEICGVASVDGSLAFNTTLSLNRANSAKEWLCKRLNLTKGQQRLIKSTSRPEGWAPVVAAMEADKHPDAAKVRAVVEQHASESDDVAEKIIRRMPCWKDIVEKYLQRDRKVDYAYSFIIPGETEEYEDYNDMTETTEEVDD